MRSRAVVKPVAHGNWLDFIAERERAMAHGISALIQVRVKRKFKQFQYL